MLFDILLLVWFHFIADFLFQSDWVAKNKSKDSAVLALHVLLYGLPFYWFGAEYAIVNMIAHFATDYITSRWTSYLYLKNSRHWFFVVIGLDQAIHLTTLILTYKWICV